MRNICESCGEHSSQTIYDLTIQHELCPRCSYDVARQLAFRNKRDYPTPPPRTPVAA